MKTSTKINLAFLIIASGFILLRFVHIEADFPSGITWSGTPYTDEGWWASNAKTYLLTGNWHVEGDYNPAINLPGFPLIQVLSFKILGISIVSARVTGLLFLILLSVTLYFLIKKYENTQTALIAICLLSINYTFFVYSRLALLEIPMTFWVVLSILLASSNSIRHRNIFTVLSAVAFAMAMFTKSTAMFALPLVLYVNWKNEPLASRRYYQCAILIAIPAACSLLYYLFIVQAYIQDYQYFTSRNITHFIKLNPSMIIKGIKRAVMVTFHEHSSGNYSHGLDKILYPIIILYSSVLALRVKQFRQNILFILSLLWILIYLSMVGVQNYVPPRYLSPLSLPLSITIAIVLDYLIRKHKTSPATIILIAAILISSSINCFNITRYLLYPNYSFISMARNIEHHIKADAQPNPTLFGDYASLTSLAIGVFQVNDVSGTASLSFKIKKYKPNYYASLGEIQPDIEEALARYYKIKLINTYDVFDNYYRQVPIFFFKLTPK